MIVDACPKKPARTRALCAACEHNHVDIFDLLYPLSNPQQALAYLRDRKTISAEQRLLLEDTVNAQKQHTVLSQQIEGLAPAPSPRRTQKM